MSDDRFCGCPYCEAVFTVPDEKIRQRDGMVRCGVCREVFDANVNLMRKTENGFELIVLAEDILEEFGPAVDASDNLLEAREEGEGDSLSHNYSSNIPAQEFRQSDSEPIPTVRSSDYDDNSYPSDSKTLPDDDEFAEFEPGKIENPFADRDQKMPDYSGSEQDDAAPEDIGEDKKPDIEVHDIGHVKPIELVADRDTFGQHQGESESHILEIESAHDQPDSEHNEGFNFIDTGNDGIDNANSGYPDLSSDSVSQIRSPDELDLGIMARNGVDEYINDRPNPLVSITWFFVALGFVFLLGMQAKYFFVERYAQDETYRKYLIGFCKVARCELAPRRDPFRYTLTHTKIDLHPTQPGALRVTVKLVNEAEFAQPYPKLR